VIKVKRDFTFHKLDTVTDANGFARVEVPFSDDTEILGLEAVVEVNSYKIDGYVVNVSEHFGQGQNMIIQWITPKRLFEQRGYVVSAGNSLRITCLSSWASSKFNVRLKTRRVRK